MIDVNAVLAQTRVTAWMALETRHCAQEFPKVFGSLVSIVSFPATGGLALRFSLAADGRRCPCVSPPGALSKHWRRAG